MFSECNSLISLPDISKWDTSKAYFMDSMFNECNSLISLPDISKWNVSIVPDKERMFSKCISLIIIPDIYSVKEKKYSMQISMLYILIDNNIKELFSKNIIKYFLLF